MGKDAFIHVPEVDLLGLGLVYFSTGFPLLDVVLGLIPFVFYLTMRVLDGPSWRGRIRTWLESGAWSVAFSGLLEMLISGLQTLFRGPWSLRAFDICFRLALIYGSLHIILNPAAGALMQNLTMALTMLALLFAGYWAAQKFRRRMLDKQVGGEISLRLQALEKGLYIAVFVLAWVIGGTDIETYYYALLALIGASLGAGMAFAVPAAIAGIVLFPLMGPFGGSAFVFLIMFPCLNAVFDWPSWAASRWLMSRLRTDAEHPRFWGRFGRLAGHVLLDIAIAVLCLYALAIAIVLMTETNQGMLMWDGFFSAGLTQPLSGTGLVFTVMLFSTLLPTLLHLFFAIFALAVMRAPGRDWIAGWLNPQYGGDEWASRAIVACYLTACAVFALVILWFGAEGLVAFLNYLWVEMGWAGPNGEYPFLSSVYIVAETLARALAG